MSFKYKNVLMLYTGNKNRKHKKYSADQAATVESKTINVLIWELSSEQFWNMKSLFPQMLLDWQVFPAFY